MYSIVVDQVVFHNDILLVNGFIILNYVLTKSLNIFLP